MYITILTVIIGVPVYQWIIVRWCKKYLPNTLKRMGLGLLSCLIKDVTELIIQTTMTEKVYCKHFSNNPFDSCYIFSAVIDINGTCSNISELTDNQLFCEENNIPFILLLVPNVLQGLSFLLVFMTALEFICSQASP